MLRRAKRLLQARNCARVLDLQGLPGAPVENIRIRNSRFTGVTKPSILKHANGIVLDNVHVNGKRVSRVEEIVTGETADAWRRE